MITIKKLILCIITVCLFLSGCGTQARINEAIGMVEENPASYFGEYDEIEYISAEYDSENDKCHLLYKKKRRRYDIINTYNATVSFYLSNGEWIYIDTDTEIVNSYLNIAETCWESEQSNEVDIRILDVSEDSERISLMWGNEKIDFKRISNSSFSYVSENRIEPIAIKYVTPYSESSIDNKVRICVYFGHKVSSDMLEMPDLIYRLAK